MEMLDSIFKSLKAPWEADMQAVRLPGWCLKFSICGNIRRAMCSFSMLGTELRRLGKLGLGLKASRRDQAASQGTEHIAMPGSRPWGW